LVFTVKIRRSLKPRKTNKILLNLLKVLWSWLLHVNCERGRITITRPQSAPYLMFFKILGKTKSVYSNTMVRIHCSQPKLRISQVVKAQVS